MTAMTNSIAERTTGEQAPLSPGTQEIIDGFDMEYAARISGNVAVAQATDFQLTYGSPAVVRLARDRLTENIDHREEDYLLTFERLMDSASGPSAPDISDDLYYWGMSESYSVVGLGLTSYQCLRDWLQVANKHEPDMTVSTLHKTLDILEEQFDSDGFAQMLADLGAAQTLEAQEAPRGSGQYLEAEMAYIQTILRDLVRDAVGSGDLEIIERCADIEFLKTYAPPSVVLELECGRARCLTIDTPDDEKLFYGAITERLGDVVDAKGATYREDIDNALKAVIGEYVDHMPSSVAQLAASIDNVTKRSYFWKAVGVHIIKMNNTARGPEYTELLEQAEYTLSLDSPKEYVSLLMHQVEYSDRSISAEQLARVTERLDYDEWLAYDADVSLMLCGLTAPSGLTDLINTYPNLIENNFLTTGIVAHRLASSGLLAEAYQLVDVKPEENVHEELRALIGATGGYLALYAQTGDEQAWEQAQRCSAKINPAFVYNYIALRHNIAVSAFISAQAQGNQGHMAEAEAIMRLMLDPANLIKSDDIEERSKGFAQHLRGLAITTESFVRAGLFDYAKDYATSLLYYRNAYKKEIEKET